MKSLLLRSLLAVLLAFAPALAYAAKDKISDYDSTAASNEDIGGISILGTAPPSNFDNALRELMSQLADNFASDTIASATTTDLGSKAAQYLSISGTTTITGLGTVKAGTMKFIRFEGALTFTHNGTSLILPGAANITTAAGDIAVVVSEGSGNWRVLAYQRASAGPLRPQSWELISTATPSAAASVDFTDLSAYRMLRITGYLLPATDNVALYLRTDTNNGASFDAGASDYAWQYIRGASTTASANTDLNDTAMQASVSTAIGNGTNEGLSFEITLTQFNQATMTRIISHANEIITDGSLAAGTVGGIRLNAAADNAIRLLFSSGNIASGYVSLEGMR